MIAHGIREEKTTGQSLVVFEFVWFLCLFSKKQLNWFQFSTTIIRHIEAMILWQCMSVSIHTCETEVIIIRIVIRSLRLFNILGICTYSLTWCGWVVEQWHPRHNLVLKLWYFHVSAHILPGRSQMDVREKRWMKVQGERSNETIWIGRTNIGAATCHRYFISL